MNLDTLMACAICRHALNEIHDNGQISYAHPVTEDERHQPKPVPAGLVPDVYLRCHICSGPHPVWLYRTADIQAAALGGQREVIQNYSNLWQVCYSCALLIDNDDSDTLTDQSSAVMGWQRGDPQDIMLRAVQKAIVLTREPQRTLLTTTDWPSATFAADTLPKVRDRLTGLLRGPARLPQPINSDSTREALANALDRSPLYWINKEFTDLILAVTGSQPKAAITDRIVPSPQGFLVWPQPVGPQRRLAAVSWRPNDNGWHILCYRSVGSCLPENLMPTLRHEIGWLIPIHAEHIANDTIINSNHPLAPVVTTWLLIAQQLAETIPAKVATSVRKAYQRGRRQPPDVRLVRIKPISHNNEAAPTAASGRSHAKPDHRYWVSAHERNQAYGPGRSQRKRIDIDPFLKGPEDKPIKLSTTVRVLGSRKPHTHRRQGVAPCPDRASTSESYTTAPIGLSTWRQPRAQ